MLQTKISGHPADLPRANEDVLEEPFEANAISSLPVEILDKVTRSLDPKDFVSLNHSCRALRYSAPLMVPVANALFAAYDANERLSVEEKMTAILHTREFSNGYNRAGRLAATIRLPFLQALQGALRRAVFYVDILHGMESCVRNMEKPSLEALLFLSTRLPTARRPQAFEEILDVVLQREQLLNGPCMADLLDTIPKHDAPVRLSLLQKSLDATLHTPLAGRDELVGQAIITLRALPKTAKLAGLLKVCDHAEQVANEGGELHAQDFLNLTYILRDMPEVTTHLAHRRLVQVFIKYSAAENFVRLVPALRLSLAWVEMSERFSAFKYLVDSAMPIAHDGHHTLRNELLQSSAWLPTERCDEGYRYVVSLWDRLHAAGNRNTTRSSWPEAHLASVDERMNHLRALMSDLSAV